MQTKSNIRKHLDWLYSLLEKPRSFNARITLKETIDYWENKYQEE